MNVNNHEKREHNNNLKNEFQEFNFHDRNKINGNEYVYQEKKQNHNTNNLQKYNYQEKEYNVKRVATTSTFVGNLQPRKRQSKLKIQNGDKVKESLQLEQVEVQKKEEQFQMIRDHEFKEDEIVENIIDDNTILSELHEFKGEAQSVDIKFSYSQTVKQIQLFKFTMKIVCPSCLKTFKSETLLYKNTKAPAIKQIHCNSLIGIYFIQNYNQKIKDLQQNTLSIGYLDSSNSKFEIVEAILIIICNCSNKMQIQLFLDILDKDKQILTCSESYRSLCKVCCKELILQNPQIILQIIKDQNKKS